MEAIYPSQQVYKTKGNSFFIATNGETSWEVANKIGLGDDSVSAGIVVSVPAYWGRYDSHLWEWINVRMSASG